MTKEEVRELFRSESLTSFYEIIASRFETLQAEKEALEKIVKETTPHRPALEQYMSKLEQENAQLRERCRELEGKVEGKYSSTPQNVEEIREGALRAWARSQPYCVCEMPMWSFGGKQCFRCGKKAKNPTQ